MKWLSKMLAALLPDAYRETLPVLGWERIFTYFFFQRILRINAHVPWPVHWSALVTSPEKITRASLRPIPGLMPGQVYQADNGISIGVNAWMAPGVKLISSHPDFCDFDSSQPASPIRIGDNCWLGANAILLPGVTLGDHTIVAAGSVVHDSFPAGNVVLAGNPAKKIKDLGPYMGSQAAAPSDQV